LVAAATNRGEVEHHPGALFPRVGRNQQPNRKCPLKPCANSFVLEQCNEVPIGK